jgi:hypothetical protein
LVDFGGMGKVLDVGCVLWCVGGPAVRWASWNGKNDGITISITNAGVKSPTFEKWHKKSISARWTFYAILIWSV